MPSSALAAMTQSQLGAQMIMNGTGRPKTANQHALAAPNIRELPRDKIGERLDHAEADDEGEDKCRRGNAEFLRSDKWHDRSLDPDHATDKGVDQDEQCELLPVLPKSRILTVEVMGWIDHG